MRYGEIRASRSKLFQSIRVTGNYVISTVFSAIVTQTLLSWGDQCHGVTTSVYSGCSRASLLGAYLAASVNSPI